MNHCVPDWDARGRDLDVSFEPTDLFSPQKGRWESGLSKKSDLAFVPDHEFEELCWEDGQLLVVNPGHGNKVATNKGWQDDELLSWLQHPLDENYEKGCHDMLGGSPGPNDSLKNTPSPFPDYVHHDALVSSVGSELPSPVHAHKNLRLDGLSRHFQHSSHLQEEGASTHTNDYELVGSNAEPASVATNREGASKMVMPLPLMPTVDARNACGSTMQAVMNFSHFSRPAVTIKANLHSIGMASGPTGTERLRQLDRVAIDACNLECVDSITKGPNVLAASLEGVGATVGVSSCQPVSSIFSGKDTELAVLAQGPIIQRSEMAEMVGSTDGSTSTIALLTDKSMEVQEVAEPAISFSSGRSDNTDSKDRNGGAACKRKVQATEDSECQSKDSGDEDGDGKSTALERSTSIKKTRAAESHNQSERRRRDRIKEKMKALQELIPNANKTDKASMLEEAIEYMKSLQTQLQFMAYRSGMTVSPTLIPPGLQHMQVPSMPHRGMGMNMGIGMGVNMGLGMGVNMGMGMGFGMSMGMGMGVLDPTAVNAATRFVQMPSFARPVMTPVPMPVLSTSGIPVSALPLPGITRSGVVPLRQPQVLVSPCTVTGHAKLQGPNLKPLIRFEQQPPVQMVKKSPMPQRHVSQPASLNRKPRN